MTELSSIQLNNEEKREQIKARRRAAYRKKDDESSIKLNTDVQNVARHPLGDITNAYQPSSMDVDERKELIKARRRAAYRKRKEEATVKQQNENLSALTISVMRVPSMYKRMCKMFPYPLPVISLMGINQPRCTLTRKRSK